MWFLGLILVAILLLSLNCRLLDMISECFGQMARANVDDIHSDHLPVILIVFKIQGSVNVRNIIQGMYGSEGGCL